MQSSSTFNVSGSWKIDFPIVKSTLRNPKKAFSTGSGAWKLLNRTPLTYDLVYFWLPDSFNAPQPVENAFFGLLRVELTLGKSIFQLPKTLNVDDDCMRGLFPDLDWFRRVKCPIRAIYQRRGYSKTLFLDSQGSISYRKSQFKKSFVEKNVRTS